MALLELRELSVKYGELTIIDRVSFSLEDAQWLMIVGPNGAGKSTIVSAVSGGTAYTGEALFKGRDVRSFKPIELARKLGVLSQNHSVGYSFTVGEVVKLGRYAYSKGVFGSGGEDDERMVEAALEETGMTKLRDQSVLTLSGGELQRTFLAQLLAQDPELLILDEPTNHLDLIYQKQMFGLIRAWIERTGRSVVSVVHDLSLARAFGTHALLLDRGRCVALGRTGEVLCRNNLSEVYGMDVYGWMNDMLGQWREEGR